MDPSKSLEPQPESHPNTSQTIKVGPLCFHHHFSIQYLFKKKLLLFFWTFNEYWLVVVLMHYLFSLWKKRNEFGWKREMREREKWHGFSFSVFFINTYFNININKFQIVFTIECTSNLFLINKIEKRNGWMNIYLFLEYTIDWHTPHWLNICLSQKDLYK